ncbi:MAG: sel1 repeat family protein [Colwelliaceae bacterium]|nr:sel1 repeat family protein [Colwelliaceae bacterium]
MSDGTNESNVKVPSQIFRWFEKMKTNYETSVQSVLSRFEDYNNKQQSRLDDANQQHLDDLKSAHKAQAQESQNNIKQLHEDIDYYKQQIAQQQHTIEQLNTRYDAVMTCLITEKSNNDSNIKNIFENDVFVTQNETELPISDNKNNLNKSYEEEKSSYDDYQENTSPLHNEDIDNETAFEQALELRNAENFEQAFYLFQQNANNNHAKSMGAMGRSYFLAEGVDENQELGLAWLIKAANLNFPQAVSRVEHYKTNEPELYQSAINLLETNQI